MATPITQAQSKQKKIDIVKEVITKLESAKSIVFADYSRLTHKQLESLRKNLKKVEGQLIVVKNNLLKRALESVSKPVDKSSITGATAILFSFADEVLPIKELIKFFNTAAAGIVKGGFLGETQLKTSDIERLATLPSRKELYSKLACQLQSPVYGLHNALRWNLCRIVWTLDAIKIKKKLRILEA